MINGKKLIAYFGSAKNIFEAKLPECQKINGINDETIFALQSKDLLLAAEKEIGYALNNSIRIISYLDDCYPKRLKQCVDCPLILFVKGNVLPEKKRMLAVVGTRNATDYGRHVCEEIISGLKAYDVGIISGLAYGIDTYAHTDAISCTLPTFAVLGNGFATVYPAVNFDLARRIADTGSLVSEFFSETKPARENFPQRNRIIAGLSDAVLVIESAAKGGSLITAEYAVSYCRDVFAVPGRINDKYSVGCNTLIKKQKSCIALSANDIIENMNWDIQHDRIVPKKLFYSLNETQDKIFRLLEEYVTCNIDFIVLSLNIPISRLSFELLDMELNGIIRCKPGKNYELD